MPDHDDENVHHAPDASPRPMPDGLLLRAMNALPVLVAYVGADQRYRFNNKAYEQWFGASVVSLRGKHVREVLGETAYALIRPHIERVLAGDETRYEWDVSLLDGTTRYVRVTYVPDFDEQRTIKGFVSLVEDLTERLRAEATIAPSHLATIVDSAMDAIITIDDGQRIVQFNRAAEQMFRCPAADAVGLMIDRFIPERFRAAHREHIRHFGHTRVTSRRMGALGQIIGLRRDGEEFPVEAAISQVEVEDERLYTVILRDITNRLLYEAMRTRYAALVESSEDAIIGMTVDGVVQSWNPAAERMYGYSAAEMIGHSIDRVAPSDRTEEVRQILERVGRGEGIHHFETIRRREDGADVYVSLTVSPVKDEVGRVIGAATIARNITERQAIQEQLRHTQRLTELGTLAAGTAHEIGTPLNVILGHAESLLRKTEDASIMRGLRVIIAQVDRVAKTVRHLLTFSRPHQTTRQPVDLNAVIDETLGIVRERMVRGKIRVERQVEADTPFILADATQMMQVLLNLVVNAIHAMPEGGILRIGVAPAGRSLKLTVMDTGCGIAEPNLSKIFDPFYTTKSVGEGTGLGLVVVRGIVQEHNGTIEVHSAPGRGTVFTILLPLHNSP